MSLTAGMSRGAFSLLDRVSIVFFGFLNVFFMARMMSKSELGIWVLFTSVTGILEMLRNGFIRNPFVAHLVSSDPAQKGGIVTASLTLHVLLSFGISLLLIICAMPLATFWNASGLGQLFFVYAATNIIFIPYLHFQYVQQSQLNFRAIFICNLFRHCPLALYIMVTFFMNAVPSLMELAIVQAISVFLGCFAGYWFIRGTVGHARAIFWKEVRELFHLGKFTVGTNISSMFVKNTDTWMIGRMISTAGVAIYNPAIRISNLVEVPTLAIASVFFPQVGKKMKENGVQGVREVYIKSVSLILALTLPMVLPLYIFAEFAILIIFGREYLEAASILRVTLFYTLIIPFNRQFGTVMDGIKKPKLNFYLLVLVALLNLVFNFYFLQAFGVIGSAFATLLSYSIVFVLNQIILYNMFGINTLHVFTAIFEWYKLGWNLFCRKVLRLA
jgi:lipopolysaccharide exporter